MSIPYNTINSQNQETDTEIVGKGTLTKSKQAKPADRNPTDSIPKNESILLLSSSLLVDRVFLHTKLIESLSNYGRVEVWATSAADDEYSKLWDNVKAGVESFPAVEPFKEFPYNFLRRFNEYVWDFRLQPPSRLSMMAHVRDRDRGRLTKSLKFPARIFSLLGSEQWLEDRIENLLLGYRIRCEEALRRMEADSPSVLVSTGLFQFEQPAIFESAKRLGIPTLAYIPSWDNVTTKNRMIYKYDGFIVWSEQTKKELREFYPAAREVPVFVVGAPQYDIFFRDEFHRSREEFCMTQGLDPDIPIIVYALGSPNFLQETNGAIETAKMVADGKLGNVQMLVRPHPIHDKGELRAELGQYSPRVRVQTSPNRGKQLTSRSQDKEQIVEWINTFRHADVVINLSSTVTIDAAFFDKPVINIDFDPQPSGADQELVKDINHKWNHFSPIAQSGGVWLVNDFEELRVAVLGYLENPGLHSRQRKWIVEYVCGFSDGKCGERMASAIGEFLSLTKHKNRDSNVKDSRSKSIN